DVEVDPGGVTDEAFDELGADDGTGALPGGGDVLDVGDIGLNPVVVVLEHGEAPGLFSCRLSGRFELGSQFVVVGEDGVTDVAEGHGDRTGEGGDVDDALRTELVGPANSVGENKAAFG